MIYLLEGNNFLISEYIASFIDKKFKGVADFNPHYSVLKNPMNTSVILNRSAFSSNDRVIIWDWSIFEKFEDFNPYVIPESLDIFVVSDKFDKRKKNFKLLVEGLGGVVMDKEFKNLYPNQVESWIMTRAGKISLKVDADAVKDLALFYGTNLQELANYLELAKTQHAKLTREIVRKTSLAVNVFSLFELQDFVMAKNAARTCYIYKELIKSGEQGFSILRYFTSYLNKLLIVKLNNEVLLETLKLHPYVLKKMKETKVSTDFCKKALEKIRDAELNIFRGLPNDYVVERTLFSICKL